MGHNSLNLNYPIFTKKLIVLLQLATATVTVLPKSSYGIQIKKSGTPAAHYKAQIERLRDQKVLQLTQQRNNLNGENMKRQRELDSHYAALLAREMQAYDENARRLRAEFEQNLRDTLKQQLESEKWAIQNDYSVQEEQINDQIDAEQSIAEQIYQQILAMLSDAQNVSSFISRWGQSFSQYGESLLSDYQNGNYHPSNYQFPPITDTYGSVLPVGFQPSFGSPGPSFGLPAPSSFGSSPSASRNLPSTRCWCPGGGEGSSYGPSSYRGSRRGGGGRGGYWSPDGSSRGGGNYGSSAPYYAVAKRSYDGEYRPGDFAPTGCAPPAEMNGYEVSPFGAWTGPQLEEYNKRRRGKW